MSSSFVSSFLIFALSGFLAICELAGYPLPIPFRVIQESSWLNVYIDVSWFKAVLCGIIIFTGVYFYFFAALCEMDPEIISRLRKSNRFEWYVRVLNQTAFMGIWFAFQASAETFCIYFIMLFVSFLVWDVATRGVMRNPKGPGGKGVPKSKTALAIVDFAGLILAIGLSMCLLWMNSGTGQQIALALVGGMMIAFTFCAVWYGAKQNAFNPLSSEFWSRAGLR